MSFRFLRDPCTRVKENSPENAKKTGIQVDTRQGGPVHQRILNTDIFESDNDTEIRYGVSMFRLPLIDTISTAEDGPLTVEVQNWHKIMAANLGNRSRHTGR